MTLRILSFLFALAVGVAATASGIGGGSFLVPYLIFAEGLPPVTAVGSSLAVIFPASLAAAVQYALRGCADWRLVALTLPPAAAGALFGAEATRFLPGGALTLAFGVVLVFSGLWLGLLRDRLRWEPGTADDLSGCRRALLVLAGGLAGFLGAILGIGGGFLLTPVLVVVFRLPARTSVAVSMFSIAAVSLAGAADHLRLGHVSFLAVWALGSGLVAGSLLGPALTSRWSEGRLRRLMGGVLATVGLVMILRRMY